MTITTILVPTDFSESSTLALNAAKDLSRAFKASIHLLHVVQDPLSQSWALESYGAMPADLLKDLEALAQKDLEKALPESERASYKATLITQVGTPFSTIVDYAKAHDIDLVVMGTHGRGALAHAILGSVTERVVRFAPCPVLSVRAK
jgi:nucleotide-binding universal stress UspA family protein